MPRSVNDLLSLALSRGVISAEQEAALRSLAVEVEGTSAEMVRGFDWVTVAYALGALLVVFASGWFLAERWVWLGAPGVLAVVSGYAAALALASRWLRSSGFPEAAGIAAMIAVSLTPVAVWSVQSMSGWWPPEIWGQQYAAYPPAEASRWVVAELSTTLAALLVLRRRRYVAVVLPVAVSLFGLVMHVPRAAGLESSPLLERWTMATGALILCAIADTVDRQNPRDTSPGRGDMAFPLWAVGLLGLSASILAFWPTAGAFHHALPVLALAAVAASLTMGRRTHLVVGVLWLFLYLVYLAAEVFRSTAFFPLVLAALGGALLFTTVWLQRRFPALVQRLKTRRTGRGGLPGSPALPWLVAVAALCITMLHAPQAAEERLNREFRQRLEVLRGHGGSRRIPMRPAGRGDAATARTGRQTPGG